MDGIQLFELPCMRISIINMLCGVFCGPFFRFECAPFRSERSAVGCRAVGWYNDSYLVIFWALIRFAIEKVFVFRWLVPLLLRPFRVGHNGACGVSFCVWLGIKASTTSLSFCGPTYVQSTVTCVIHLTALLAHSYTATTAYEWRASNIKEFKTIHENGSVLMPHKFSDMYSSMDIASRDSLHFS